MNGMDYCVFARDVTLSIHKIKEEEKRRQGRQATVGKSLII